MDEILSKLVANAHQKEQFGDDPDKSDIREEVQRLKEQGKSGMEIGQTIGPLFMTQPEYGQDELDMLEEVLTEEFEDYGSFRSSISDRGVQPSKINC